MKLLSSSAIAIFLCLLVLLTAIVGDSYALAWCRGDDGHTRLEQASVMGCIDQDECAPLQQEVHAETSVVADPDCGPCIDDFLNRGDVIITKRPNKAAKVLVDVRKPQIPLACPDQPLSPVAFHAPPGKNQALRSLRTVVLLN